LPYREETVFQSYFQVLRHLRAIGSDTSLDIAIAVPLDGLVLALGDFDEGVESRPAEVQQQAGSRT
jgi:hypothetical protein